jgi:hypothetical protein
MAGLLESDDPVLSLLSGVFSGGLAGRPNADGSMTPGGRQASIDALMAAGGTLANAAAPGFGPRPTILQGITSAMSAGQQAAYGEQQREQSATILQQAGLDAQMRRNILQRQLEMQDLAQRMILQSLGGRPGGMTPAAPTPGATPGAAPAGFNDAPGYVPGASVQSALLQSESGGGYGARNSAGYLGGYQLGTGLASDAGLYAPATGEDLTKNQWAGSFKIPGFENVKTAADFQANPAAQDAAYRIAMGHLDGRLRSMGIYDRAQARGSIGGVNLTRDGLLAGAWLGGPGGVRDWIDHGTDATDSNGTPVSRWAALAPGAKGAPAVGPAAAPAGAPAPAVAANDTGNPPPNPALLAGPGAPDVAPAVRPTTGPWTPPGAPQTAQGGPPPTLPSNAPADGNPLNRFSQQQLLSVLMLPPEKRGQALFELSKQVPNHITLANPADGGKPWMYEVQPGGQKIPIGPAPSQLDTVDVQGQDGKNYRYVRNPDGTPGKQIGLSPTQQQLDTVDVRDPTDGQTYRYQKRPDGTPGVKIGLSPVQPQLETVDVQDADGFNYRYVRNPNGTAGTKLGLSPVQQQHETVDVQGEDGRNYRYARNTDGSQGKLLGLSPVQQMLDTIDVQDKDGRNYRYARKPDGTAGPLIGLSPVQQQRETVDVQAPDGRNYRFVRNPDGTQGKLLGLAPVPPEGQLLSPEVEAQRRRLALAASGDEFDKTLAKNTADRVQSNLTNRDTANAMRSQLDQLDSVMQTYRTNAAAGIQKTIGEYGAAAGLDLSGIIPGTSPKDAMNAEVFGKIANGLVMRLLGGKAGEGFPSNNFSDADRSFLSDTMPSLTNRPEANQVISAFLRAQAQRNIDKAGAMEAYPDQSAIGMRRFESEWQKKLNDAPLVRNVKTLEDMNALPPGTIWHRTGSQSYGVVPRVPTQ